MGVRTLIPLLFTVFVLLVEVQGQKTSHLLCLAMGCYTKSLIRPPQCATLCDSRWRSFPPVGPPPIWSPYRNVGGGPPTWPDIFYPPPKYRGTVNFNPFAPPPPRPLPWVQYRPPYRSIFPPRPRPPWLPPPPWRRLDPPPPPPPIGGPGYGLGYGWRRLDPPPPPPPIGGPGYEIGYGIGWG